jgi:hypothetical protein
MSMMGLLGVGGGLRVGGGGTARQAMIATPFGPVYLNQTTPTRQVALPGTYVNET